MTQNKEHSALGCTFAGFEPIAVREVSELLGKKATSDSNPGIIFFFATDTDLAHLSYKTQALRSVLRLFGHFSFSSSLESFQQFCTSLLKKTDLALFAGKTFRVDCDRTGEHPFSSQDCAAAAGALLLSAQPQAKVALTDPDIIVRCIIRDTSCFLGIDVGGVDLTKREYKIYGQSNILNASFAYCAVRFAGYTGKEVLLDPLCGVGLIPLEAALFAAGISPRLYQKDHLQFQRFLPLDLTAFDPSPGKKEKKEKKENQKNQEKRENKLSITGYDVHLRNIEAAKKHAKLANVSKIVTFARADIEWIDTKCEEKSVDIVVTQPPVEGRFISEKEMEKVYKEFFYQLEFVLKDSGKMVLLCQKTGALKAALDYFVIADEYAAYQGEQKFVLVTLKKK